ncbi:HIT domain-containing protein, partial [Staphylococcus epidermidis]|uniref:HIT domain-containing protein n=1 Tax=Staphylococcus epidermidis TaxID=1282 RepID=UPI0011A5E4D8
NHYLYPFLHISQLSKPHTLLLPKKPSPNIFQTHQHTIKHIPLPLPKLPNPIKKPFHPHRFNIIQNNPQYPHQSLFHIHFHLIP